MLPRQSAPIHIEKKIADGTPLSTCGVVLGKPVVGFQRSHHSTNTPSELVTRHTHHADGGQPASSEGRPSRRRYHRLTRIDAIVAVALLGFSISVRWPLIQHGETLLHPDEAIVGIMAQDIREGVRFPIYFYGQRYMGALEAYVVAACDTLIDDPLIALRLGPCLFFAVLVVLQYLMLTRWFGRCGGLIGAATLVFASPWFAQWCVSARGGYIEILLWGSALIWAYSEWFMGRPAATPLQRLAFGYLIGSGFWINPSILFFVLPVVVHAIIVRGLPHAKAFPALRRASLPCVAILSVLLLNGLWSVRVDDVEIKTTILLDLFPRPVAISLLIVVAIIVAVALRRTWCPGRVRGVLQCNAPLVLGALLGATPAMTYVAITLLRGTAMEPSLPLGFRPLWHTGETLLYYLHGLPLLFGANPQAFLDLVTVGRDHALRPAGPAMAIFLAAARIVVIVAGIAIVSALVRVRGKELALLFSLRGRRFSATALLALGVIVTIGLYLLGGCSCSFTTIRYLVPMWAFVPGLIASVYASPRAGRGVRVAVISLVCAWGIGQFALIQRIGAPHPLRAVANELTDSGTKAAVADILDAHLVSYLSRQRVRLVEYDPFWSRLAHYQAEADWQRSWHKRNVFVVNVRDIDRTQDWTDAGFPGPPPPETQRFCWPALQAALARDPSICLTRQPLGAGYEWICLARPVHH